MWIVFLTSTTQRRSNAKRIIFVDIGKDLAHYDVLDTGMFLCSPALFDRLESAKRDGSCSLSDGMRQLAREQKLRAFDIGDATLAGRRQPRSIGSRRKRL